MEYDISYSSVLDCYIWWHEGYGMCLGAETHAEAIEEVEDMVAHGIYPEDDDVAREICEADNFDDSMDGDFDSAMASAGHGTDEDYGYYGDD